MPKIKVNDINLYYESHGKGQPIIFVTGFNADRTIWQNLVDVFAKHYQVIIFDNRGSGMSDAPDIPYTVEMMADDLAALCSALHIEKSHIVGISMGGAIVQTFAFKYPHRCHTAVIVNSFIKIDIRFALFAKGNYELMKLGASPQALTEIVLGLVFSSYYLNKPDAIETLITTALENPPPTSLVGYKNQLNALLEFNSETWVGKMNVPCLVISSDQDGIVSEEHMRNMAKKIPGALYHCFNGASHFPHIEEPEGFNKIVLAFTNYYN